MSGKSISYPHQSTRVGDLAAGIRPQHQSRSDFVEVRNAMTTCYAPGSYELPVPTPRRTVSNVDQKYLAPLHVDCSVEYELPNAAKPPQGVRNEPLLMIHPFYFRKIESQRRSPFINNLPARPATMMKRRTMPRGQPVPGPAVPYTVQYTPTPEINAWAPNQQPALPSQPYCKREVLSSTCTYAATPASRDSGFCWSDCDSPERPDDKHISLGKYRSYIRAHRLHPYISSTIPLATTFPHQIQQVCYNV